MHEAISLESFSKVSANTAVLKPDRHRIDPFEHITVHRANINTGTAHVNPKPCFDMYPEVNCIEYGCDYGSLSKPHFVIHIEIANSQLETKCQYLNHKLWVHMREGKINLVVNKLFDKFLKSLW